jgi:omega-6 fatty acid desaturase (delta-12 desaturase)
MCQEFTDRPAVPLTRREIVRELTPFAITDDVEGLKLFCTDILLYVGGLMLVLFGPALPWKVAGSLLAGLKLSGLITLGHDAAHRMLVKNKRLNRWLAYGCFLPIFHNYRLWIWDHHAIHHQHTNGGHFDSFTPYSKSEFDRLPLRKQVFERFIRAPNVLGFAVHYLFQRMPRVRILPTAATPERYRAGAWRDFGLMVAYQVVFLATLSMAPRFAPVTTITALLLGFVVPMLVFGTLVGGSLFLMHTHRGVPWFRPGDERGDDLAFDYCSTNLVLPHVLSKLVHHVFAHSVHHAHPAVPCYRTPEAQARLSVLLGGRLVTEPLSVGGAIATLNACKLYDYEHHQWLSFDGAPTSEKLVVERSERNLTSHSNS